MIRLAAAIGATAGVIRGLLGGASRSAALPATAGAADSGAEDSDEHTLDSILGRLDACHQRATYGAVGGLLEKPPRFLMQGRPKDHRHSWVVSQKDHLPGGYTKEQMHPALLERSHVISSADELRAWLREGC